MANKFETNKKVELIAARAAEVAGYLTVGSKAYFKDQLIGKRNGRTYGFVMPDTGNAFISEDGDMSGKKSELKERVVNKKILDSAILIDTNLIESVTDVEWDREIAVPNGGKLIQSVVKETVKNDIGAPTTAFFGEGFKPLSQASGHVRSVADEQLYGFIEPNAESVLTALPQESLIKVPDGMYANGFIGKYHEVEYRSQRFFPVVNITVESGTATWGEADEDGDIEIQTAGIVAGQPLYFEGVYATDTLGDATANLRAFIPFKKGDKLVIAKPAFSGAKDCIKEDGSEVSISDLTEFTSAPVGKYYVALIRANGAMEFETLDKIDLSNAQSETGKVQGVTVHQNRAVNVEAGTNATRWDLVSLAGIVDGRIASLALIKA